LAACAEEVPPTPVEEYMTDRPLLDSTLARCNADRVGSLDDRDCSNARRAVERLWRQQEQERREAREKEFERKREALRAQADREQAVLEEQRKIREALQREEEIYGGVSFSDSVTEPGANNAVDPPAQVTGTAGDGGAEPQQFGSKENTADTPQPESAPVDPLQAVEDELAKRREAAQQAGDR